MPSMPRNCGSVAGIAAQAHQRVGAREAEQVDQLRQLGRRVAEDHAAAGVDHRAAWPPAAAARAFLIWPRVALAHRVVRAHRDRRRDSRTRACALRDVLRDVDHAPGPGRPVRRCGTPSSSSTARSFTSLTRKLCLTHGRVMPTVSHSWKASWPIACVGTWPVMITIGIESMYAVAMPVTALVTPGPGGDQRDADFAGRARIAVGRVHRAPARGAPGRA